MRWATAMPSVFCKRRGALPIIALSQRLMNSEATEGTSGFSPTSRYARSSRLVSASAVPPSGRTRSRTCSASSATAAPVR